MALNDRETEKESGVADLPAQVARAQEEATEKGRAAVRKARGKAGKVRKESHTSRTILLRTNFVLRSRQRTSFETNLKEAGLTGRNGRDLATRKRG